MVSRRRRPTREFKIETVQMSSPIRRTARGGPFPAKADRASQSNSGARNVRIDIVVFFSFAVSTPRHLLSTLLNIGLSQEIPYLLPLSAYFCTRNVMST